MILKKSGQSHEVVVATVNVNGLPKFRQKARTRELLLPYDVRHRKLCELIEASEIDVINLQEVFTHQDRRLFEEYLPSFKYVSFESSIAGPKGALMTFSRLPMEKIGYESYAAAAKSIDKAGLPLLSKTKSAMKGILISRIGARQLTVLNTHPLANDDWDWSSGNRFQALQEAFLEQLVGIVQQYERANENEAIFLGGDLNVAKDSKLFARFLGKVGLRDAFHNDTSPTFYGEFLDSGLRTRCIDFLLVSSTAEVTSQRRIFEGKVMISGKGEVYLTDHFGLSATITL